MPALPPRLSLEQVRRLAKDLLRDLKSGDRAAIRRLAVVSAPSTLAGAQLAIAREYGFTVATRNVKHFPFCKTENPFAQE